MIKTTIPWTGSHINRDDIDTDEGVIVLKRIEKTLKDKGYCYIEIIRGDYEGSIAKFTPDTNYKEQNVVSGRYTREGKAIINYHWRGRLSWERKRNSPSFDLHYGTCTIIEDYDGPTVFVRKDFKAIKEDLLKTKVKDIDGNILNIGDEVLYMNLRYGAGGKLSKGIISKFKPNARQNYVSVIISNFEEEESELNYPMYQVYKLRGVK